MSYILDALKKSEQERQGTSGPSVHTIHSKAPKSTNNHAAIIALCTFCLACLGAGGYFYYVSLQAPNTQQLDEQEAQGSKQPIANAVQAQAQLVPTKIEAPKEVVEFWQLPDPIQSEIPSLTFSFHVYSESAEKRTIIINKIRLKEGGKPLPDLLLKEITKEGVILSWKEKYVFYIPVVESW